MGCYSDNALCIDTTFNLFSSWVTDSSNSNDCLTTNEGKHSTFVGPTTVHFEMGAFLFSCFSSEMPNTPKTLKPKSGSQAINTILANIYGRQYSTMIVYGLADSRDANDLATRFESLRESSEKLCPGFHKWFVNKRKVIFQNSVMKCARKNTNVHGLF